MTGMKAERAGQPPAPAQRGERLLVVDDDPDVRDSLKRALRCAGYAVTTAVHGADALDALARAPVDLIVLDVLMPMVDVSARRLTRGDRIIELTRTEFGLLELLLRNAEQVISYDVIRERVWGYGEAPASNALQVFVGFLRRKLEEGGGPRLLHNVRGVGYVIRTAP
jgi:DNA-binding response OmpR family regulator